MAGSNFYFNPDGSGLEVFLGPTETKLMELAWEEKEITVKRALFLLDDNDKSAYTTIMTIYNRLVTKGLLLRKKDGKTFIYIPAVSRSKFLSSRIKTVSKCLKQFK